ncbi:MAG: hypothetical protein GX621_05865 [Pirellulaceae bacterium]|nr:hypothetical protein [Pirellulaceae bacterium]
MHAKNQAAQADRLSPPRRGRRWFRILAVAVAALVLLIAAIPWLASFGPVRTLLLRASSPRINGSIRVGEAKLGWFSPIHFEQIEIRSHDGDPVVSIPRLEGNRPLWRMLLSRSNLGDLRVEQPRLNVVLDAKGSNLTEVFAGRRRDETEIRRPPDVALGIRLIDAAVTVRGVDSEKPWTAEPIDFAFRLKPAQEAADGRPRLEIEPGEVFSRAEITPEVCHDLLKYLAPVLADATEVTGDFSMELDRWQFPLENFAEGQGAGRFTIHRLDVGAGPLIRELAGVLKLRPSLVAVENAPIAFWMEDGRVHHGEFTFQLERVTIRTSGSVGVDGTLSMVAEMPMPAHLLGDRPLAAALARQTLKIPIRGTLAKPEVDGQALIRSLGESGLDVLDELRLGEQIDLGKLLEGIRQRRQQQQQQQQRTTGESDQPNPRDRNQRPLQNLIRSAIDEALKEPQQKPEQSP